MQGEQSVMDFVHPSLGEEITAIGGHYSFTKEGQIAHAGRMVLYLVGYGSIDTSCCGVGGCIYALVPGYMVSYRDSAHPQSLRPISKVAPVEEDSQASLAQALKDLEGVTQVHFFTAQGGRKVLS
jgi:hypothetical protein